MDLSAESPPRKESKKEYERRVLGQRWKPVKEEPLEHPLAHSPMVPAQRPKTSTPSRVTSPDVVTVGELRRRALAMLRRMEPPRTIQREVRQSLAQEMPRMKAELEANVERRLEILEAKLEGRLGREAPPTLQCGATVKQEPADSPAPNHPFTGATPTDWGAVHWRHRLCYVLRSDQLLEYNAEIALLYATVTKKTSQRQTYQLVGREFQRKQRTDIISQVDKLFASLKSVCIEGCDVRRIAADDPRVSLRGQWGLFCSSNGPALPDNHILGAYAGYVCTDKQYEKMGVSPGNAAMSLEHERYLFTFNSKVKGKKLMVHPYDAGNELILINDYRVQPFVDDAPFRRANTQFLEVLHNGWPHVFIITTQTIQPGDELLIDYGNRYWEQQRRLVNQTTTGR